MSVHRITLKDGRPTWKVRFRQDGANRSRSFARRSDAQAFESELRRRRQLGALATQQLTERGGPTLGEWVELRWAVEHASTLAQSTRDRYSNVYAVHIAPTLDAVPLAEVTVGRAARVAGRAARGGRGRRDG